MTKKNDKRLCWNCEGNVSHHLAQCPYCGVDVTKPREETSVFKGYGTSFQNTPKEIPQPPFAKKNQDDFLVTKEEWNSALHSEKERVSEEDKVSPTTKREVLAFLLLLPGVVFFLFGLALILFSRDGILSLQWNQNVAYFYFLGAIPLLYLSWRALK